MASNVPRFQRIQTNDFELNLLQNRIAQVLDALTTNPLSACNFLSQKALKVGSNLVNHGLGRNYVSFLYGNTSAPVRLSAGASPDPSQVINIIADAPCVVDLLPY